MIKEKVLKKEILKEKFKNINIIIKNIIRQLRY